MLDFWSRLMATKIWKITRHRTFVLHTQNSISFVLRTQKSKPKKVRKRRKKAEKGRKKTEKSRQKVQQKSRQKRLQKCGKNCVKKGGKTVYSWTGLALTDNKSRSPEHLLILQWWYEVAQCDHFWPHHTLGAIQIICDTFLFYFRPPPPLCDVTIFILLKT